jgi:hypothetical protein
MAISKAEIRGISIVFLGDFNPIIFQPRWFVSENLITKAESDSADVQIVHADVTNFQLPWISLSVTRDRAQFICVAQPYFERVVSLTCNVLELLRHTPIRVLGINHEAHIRASSVEKWNNLGDALAPKSLWKEFFHQPGLQILMIRQIPRMDGMQGHTDVAIQPSTQLTPGVYVNVNEHFELAKSETMNADRAVTVLKQKWPESGVFAEDLILRIEKEL